MARIVQGSNFDLDWFNEEFILGIMGREAALEICEVINKYQTSTDEYWYRVVDNDYKLHIGMET